jgi:hypothetical protein
MKYITPTFITALLAMLIATSLTAAAFGQKPGDPAYSVETATVFPHDFSDKFYAVNGVNSAAIKGRLTGADFLSVPENTSDWRYAPIRVLVTLAARSGAQEAIFWNPLGTISYEGVSEDAAGSYALGIAQRNAVYVFPNAQAARDGSIFGDMAQSVVFDDSANTTAREENPLGLRLVITVHIRQAMTRREKAVLNDMGAKNGFRADGLPIVRSASDISVLSAYDLVELSKGTGTIAIAPTLDPNRIADDAFLSIPRPNGQPLEAELDLVKLFEYYRATSVRQ